MHAVIRRWNAAANLIAEMANRKDEVERVISSSPGFVQYHAIRTGDTIVSVTICQDRAGCEESSRLAAAWVKETFPPEAVAKLKPEILEGDAFINFGVPQRLGGATARA